MQVSRTVTVTVTAPAQPVQPVTPVNPNQPNTPDTPNEPNTPTNPAQPNKPVTPDIPNEPATPEQPAKTVTPAQPNKQQVQNPITWSGKAGVAVHPTSYVSVASTGQAKKASTKATLPQTGSEKAAGLIGILALVLGLFGLSYKRRRN